MGLHDLCQNSMLTDGSLYLESQKRIVSWDNFTNSFLASLIVVPGQTQKLAHLVFCLAVFPSRMRGSGSESASDSRSASVELDTRTTADVPPFLSPSTHSRSTMIFLVLQHSMQTLGRTMLFILKRTQCIKYFDLLMPNFQPSKDREIFIDKQRAYFGIDSFDCFPRRSC